MPHLPNQTRTPVWCWRESTTCTQNTHTHTHTHRRAARPQAAHIPNGSLHASGRSCAPNEGRTKTLPALPLRAARGEHGSGANMPLLLNSMTLPIPSRDSPDTNSWPPANLNSSGSESCPSDGNSTFLMPGSGNTRNQKHTEFPGGGKPGDLQLLQRC